VKTLRTIGEVRQALGANGRVGLVPTMGAFHEGHLALFRAARDECDIVVVSLFLNPSQFGANEDLSRYPQDEARDATLAAKAGVDILFAPSPEEMYPEGYATWIDVVDTGAEGSARPDHFRGVATVCLKLFNIVRPQVAYFGQKDAQQAVVLRRMIRDLDVDLDLRVLPTIRDADGLALSSRNAYLSGEERRLALALPRALEAGRVAYAQGSDPVLAARDAFNGVAPDYIDVLDLGGATVLAAAARIGTTRLIDNIVLEGELR
jgi:pantoate--beta-alanine ligase